jgi:soluble lytic murein transglycosylase-like protein
MDVGVSKPKGMIRNKYLEYRRMYNESCNFSKSLASTKTPDTPKKPSEDKPSETASNEKAAQNPPASSSPESASSESYSLNNLTGSENSGTVSPEVSRHAGRMQEKLQEYKPHIKAAAARYNIPEELIAGVIWQESRGNPRAVSHCGAMGLMQLMPGTAQQLGVANAFSPGQNIDGGAKYIRQMLDKFGRVDFAVAAYNAGPGNVSKHGGIPPFRETQDYVPKVLGYANGFKVAGGFQDTAATNAVRV